MRPNTFNPNTMPRETYSAMLEDMRTGGLDAINPIEVRPVDGKPPYEIIDGESRWSGARELRWTRIRAEVKPMSLEEAKAECYRKNKERGHIDPFKEAELFKSEIDAGLTQREVATKYGVSHGYVGESLRLLANLQASIRREASVLLTRVSKNSCTPVIDRSHLEQLASVKDKVQQRHLFETMVGSVRAGKPPPTVRQLEVERKKLEHPPEPSDVPSEELFLDNVWPPEPMRDDAYGNSEFQGNCSGTVCKQCLWRYTKTGEVVLDPMAGSGTMVDVARSLGRKCVAFEINPAPYRDDIRQGDARKLPLDDESVDFVFLHPPYWRMHQYSDPPIEGDLSAMEYGDFLQGMGEVFKEVLRILRPGRFAAVLIGDMRKDLKFYDLPSELSVIGRSAGLELYDKVIKPTVMERSSNPNSVMLARKYNFHLIKFETLLIFKKTDSIRLG
jgi:ParB/RepB/Spo0J family partition protein